MSLANFFPNDANAVNAWLHANPGYVNNDENAAKMWHLAEQPTIAELDAAWAAAQAAPDPGPGKVLAGVTPADALATLRSWFESAPVAKSQLKTLADSIERLGGPWLYFAGRTAPAQEAQ